MVARGIPNILFRRICIGNATSAMKLHCKILLTSTCFFTVGNFNNNFDLKPLLFFPLTFGWQSQFRFDNEVNISLPENHKRVREPAPSLALAEIPDPPVIPDIPETPEIPASAEEDTREPEVDAASVVVKDDATPRGRRTADEAKEVAAAHASMLVDIEACKRVSMARCSLLI